MWVYICSMFNFFILKYFVEDDILMVYILIVCCLNCFGVEVFFWWWDRIIGFCVFCVVIIFVEDYYLYWKGDCGLIDSRYNIMNYYNNLFINVNLSVYLCVIWL